MLSRVTQPPPAISSEVAKAGWDVMTWNLCNEGVGVSEEVLDEAVVMLAGRNR